MGLAQDNYGKNAEAYPGVIATTDKHHNSDECHSNARARKEALGL
jgi:hypothetical protein